ncbi:DedA family protein [Leptolyngbya sp. FACHB-261]|uniref:DedA family protein n=1 Tax=Leptolyngbya sp. FACHB-261 TaxID=2692806 RepID=UPI0016847D9F|nr:DedA family protein [Leptolyngbya sp. FACHB-261]MBD2103142.1 DedA family protein [Leptolyngbya sp. FACHB-261]
MSFEFLTLETIQELAQQYGYWTVFCGILLENAGIPVPGETITLVGGFLAGNGDLNYWLVMLSATAGAILGDNVGYWLGAWGGWPLLVKVGRVFKLGPEELEKARTKFNENADQAVFFGRFVALLRIFAGPMAGIAQMPYRRFLVFNAAGALVWGALTVSLAYFVGALVPLEKLVAWSAQLGGLILLLVVGWLAVSRWRQHLAQTGSGEPLP